MDRRPIQNPNDDDDANLTPIALIGLGTLLFLYKPIQNFWANPNKMNGLSLFGYFMMLVAVSVTFYIFNKTKRRQTSTQEERQHEIERLLKQAEANSLAVENKLREIKTNYGIDFDLEVLPDEYKELEAEFKSIISQFQCHILQIIARDPTVFCYESKSSSTSQAKPFTEVYSSVGLLRHIQTIDSNSSRNYPHPTSNVEVGRDALMASVRLDHTRLREQLILRLDAFATKAKAIKTKSASLSLASTPTSTSVVSAASIAAPATLRDAAINTSSPHSPTIKKRD